MTAAIISVLLISFVIKHPDGYGINCNIEGYTYPVPYTETFEVSASCQGFDCTAKLSNGGNFKGFVVSATRGTVGFLTPSTGLLKSDKKCLVHGDNSVKSLLNFKWNPPSKENFATLFITLVSAKSLQSGKHLAGFKKLNVAKIQHVYIIGAGPGGLSAARWLNDHVENTDFTVLERGSDPGATWYTRPINDTYGKNMNFDVMNSGAPETQLASMVGGQQNINGAVYAPGTPGDLAQSINVTLHQALYLQSEAGKYVHQEDHLMWKCILEPNCDYGTLAVANSLMARRSIAYDLDFHVETNAVVQQVTNNTITFQNDTKITMEENECVILSAGALQSPQLIGKTEFNGWNHYYTVSPTALVEKQVFRYPDSNKNSTEINTGNFQGYALEILMDMFPTFREYHQVGVPYNNPHPLNWSQAWHFAGTMNHTNFLVDGFSRVYTGDAGALKSPFNCHTSMPAAAAGIAAAHTALGIPIGELDFADHDLTIKDGISTSEVVITGLWFAPTALYLALGLPWPPMQKPNQVKVAGRLVF